MDSRGSIYEIDEKEAKNIETNVKVPVKNVKFDDMVQLTPGQKEMLLGMNRAERRKWFKENKRG